MESKLSHQLVWLLLGLKAQELLSHILPQGHPGWGYSSLLVVPSWGDFCWGITCHSHC